LAAQAGPGPVVAHRGARVGRARRPRARRTAGLRRRAWRW
jgi:hypothetical protein